MTTAGGGETDGPPPVDGCYPTWSETEGETGGGNGDGDGEQEGLVSVCSGTGNGWIRSVIYITGPDPEKNAITRYNCVNPPQGVEPEDVTEQHCIDNPLDLEQIVAVSDGAVPNPAVCCTESTLPADLKVACRNDCAPSPMSATTRRTPRSSPPWRNKAA